MYFGSCTAISYIKLTICKFAVTRTPPTAQVYCTNSFLRIFANHLSARATTTPPAAGQVIRLNPPIVTADGVRHIPWCHTRYQTRPWRLLRPGLFSSALFLQRNPIMMVHGPENAIVDVQLDASCCKLQHRLIVFRVSSHTLVLLWHSWKKLDHAVVKHTCPRALSVQPGFNSTVGGLPKQIPADAESLTRADPLRCVLICSPSGLSTQLLRTRVPEPKLTALV